MISNIKKQENKKTIIGFKVATSSLPISHTLFPDNSLFLYKATSKECKVILNIIRNMERF